MSEVTFYDLDRVRGDLEAAMSRLERRIDDVERADRDARRSLFRDLSDGLAEIRGELELVRAELRELRKPEGPPRGGRR